MEKKEIKIRLSEKVYQMLAEQAKELGMPRSSYIAYLILTQDQKKGKETQ